MLVMPASVTTERWSSGTAAIRSTPPLTSSDTRVVGSGITRMTISATSGLPFGLPSQ